MRIANLTLGCALALAAAPHTACADALVVPNDVFVEYGHITSDSRNSALDASYVQGHSETLGADFTVGGKTRTGLRLFGGQLELTGHTAQQDATTSSRDQYGVAGYVSHFVFPFLEAGLAGRYIYGTGDSAVDQLFGDGNISVPTRERSSQWAASPYLTGYLPLSSQVMLSLTAQPEYSHSAFWYELWPLTGNGVPSATVWSWVMHDTLMLRYMPIPRLQLFTWGAAHDVLERRTFANVQTSSVHWFTIGVGASYKVWDGIDIFGRVSRNLSDEHFALVGASGGLMYRF